MERARLYDLTFEKRPDWVVARLRSATIDHLTVLDYLAEIAVTCAKWHSRALLIERDIPMVLSDEEMLDSWGVFLNTRTEMRVALFNPHPDIEQPLQQLVSATHVGGVNAAYFRDISAAERWIAA